MKFQRNGSDFIPSGANYIDEPTPGQVVTFDIAHYDGAVFRAAMKHIATYKYNTVRLFLWPYTPSASSSNGTINSAYAANVADGIHAAHENGLAVILSCAGFPSAWTHYATPTPPYASLMSGSGANWLYLTQEALTDVTTYLGLMLAALRAAGVTADMLLALEVTGEIGYILNVHPFTVTGSVTTKTGTYTLPAQRAALMNDGIRGFLNGNVGGTYQGVVAAAKAGFPGVPIMVQLQPAAYGQDPALFAFPNQTVLTSGTQDAVGLSLYATYDVPLTTVINSLGVGNPLPATYIYTALETGWLASHAGTLQDLANAQVRWIADSWTAGVYGYSWFLWDTSVVNSSGYWPMTAGGDLFARALSPPVIGDGSGTPVAGVPASHPTVLPDVHHELYLLDIHGNPATFINGRPVYGPVAGWKGLSYSATGAAIDKVPQNSVTIPLSDWRNTATDTSVQLLVRDTAISDDPTLGEVTRGPILSVNQTVDETGTHWAQVAFADELYELSRADVTSGFATSQNETLATTMTRLLSLADTSWTGSTDVTGLDGVAFTASGSIAQAADKLRQERFAHFRREQTVASGVVNPRLFHLSAFGTPWLINNQPVWFVEPGANVTGGAQNPNMRQIFTPQINKRGEIVNSYTPTGGGNGVSQLTLRTLYGNPSFTGFDAYYLVQQRIQQAGSTSDGYDYFIEDPGSIAQYGRTRGRLDKPDISAVVNTAGGVSAVDEVNAAVALYTTTVAQLKLTAHPITELTFTTPGIGDVRHCGGLVAHVRFMGYAFDPSRQVYQFLDLDDDYTILDCVRTVDDATGTATDTFTLSSTGQAVATTGGTLLGVMDTVTAMHAGVQTYPFGRSIPKSQNIGPGAGGIHADLNVNIPADNSVVRRHWAFLYLTLSGMVHTRSDTGHTQDVVTTPINHDVNAVPHDVGTAGTVTHDLYAHADWSFRVGGVNTPTGGVVYDPKTVLHISTGTPPAGAKTVVCDGTHFWLVDGSHSGTDVQMSSQLLSILQANPTPAGSGTGGALKPTTGGTGGTLQKTSGGTGGQTLQQTHTAGTVQSPTGHGALTAVATQESVYLGPSPTGVTVLVDGIQRFGPFNTSPAALDILPFCNDQAAHVVTIRSPTNGAADVIIDIRDDVSTFAVKPSS